MPKTGATPPQPVNNLLNALAAIQGQEGLGTTRLPLDHMAISKQGQ
jgi:hypothetical protein